MKKMIPLLTTLLIIMVVVILFLSLSKKEDMTTLAKGNFQKIPLPIKKGHVTDTECKMVITDTTHAAEVIAPDGKTWFFDDPGCMIKWIEDKPFKKEAVIWVKAVDTGKWIDAKKAWYAQTDKTPMHYGFGAREHKKEGYITFDEMRLKMLRGENLTDPRIRKKLLGY
jgi:nitrous oxide reductase accessory protein NosL